MQSHSSCWCLDKKKKKPRITKQSRKPQQQAPRGITTGSGNITLTNGVEKRPYWQLAVLQSVLASVPTSHHRHHYRGIVILAVTGRCSGPSVPSAAMRHSACSAMWKWPGLVVQCYVQVMNPSLGSTICKWSDTIRSRTSKTRWEQTNFIFRAFRIAHTLVYNTWSLLTPSFDH